MDAPQNATESFLSAMEMSVGLAHVLAQAHADSGLRQYNALNESRLHANQRGEQLTFFAHVSLAVPAITSLAFAAELFYKVVYFQHFGRFYERRTHDLLAMFDALPPSAREMMEAVYDEMCTRPVQPPMLHFGLSAGETSESTPVGQVPEVDSLRGALEHLRKAFETWRYVYERLSFPVSIDVNMKALLFAIEAARAHVARHQGNLEITLR